MRCEGGVAPGSFRSLYAPIERASGGVAVQASLIFLRKRGLGFCFLVEVNGLAAALKALW